MRARVPRAQEINRPPSLPLQACSLFPLWNGTRGGPTAAVERAHSDRTRSGSRRTTRLPSSPPPSFFVTFYKGAGSLDLNCARRTTTTMLLPSLLVSLHGRVVCLISHCARPTRAFSGRASREHRRSTDHPPLTPTPVHTPSPLLFLRTTDTGPARPPT
jgi:hypothetical protein